MRDRDIDMRDVRAGDARGDGAPIARGPRARSPRRHPALTALRVDFAYLVGDGVAQYVLVAIMPVFFSIIFGGSQFSPGFGYRLGVGMTVFTFSVVMVTLAVIDIQAGRRLRGIETVSRRHQVAGRYLMGLGMCAAVAVETLLLDAIQLFLRPSWPFAASLWAMPAAALVALLVVVVWVPLGYGWNSANGVQVTVLGLYAVMLAVLAAWGVLPDTVTGPVLAWIDAMRAHAALALMLAAVLAALAVGLSYAVSVRVLESKEW